MYVNWYYNIGLELRWNLNKQYVHSYITITQIYHLHDLSWTICSCSCVIGILRTPSDSVSQCRVDLTVGLGTEKYNVGIHKCNQSFIGSLLHSVQMETHFNSASQLQPSYYGDLSDASHLDGRLVKWN